MKNKDASKLLSDIGFTEKEAAAYLKLLEYDAMKAAELARKVDIHRVAIYPILESLKEKGIISEYKKGRTTYFSALPPKTLLTYLDRESEALEARNQKHKAKLAELLPQMQSRQHARSDKPKIRFYEGEKAMREAYEDTLTAKEPIAAYANVQTMHEGLPNFFPRYYQRRVDAKVGIRAILPHNPASEQRATKDQAELRQSRFLPSGADFSPEVNIYDNKVLIASWKEQMAVLIESQELADMHKTIFEALWQQLPRR